MNYLLILYKRNYGSYKSMNDIYTRTGIKRVDICIFVPELV